MVHGNKSCNTSWSSRPAAPSSSRLWRKQGIAWQSLIGSLALVGQAAVAGMSRCQAHSWMFSGSWRLQLKLLPIVTATVTTISIFQCNHHSHSPGSTWNCGQTWLYTSFSPCSCILLESGLMSATMVWQHSDSLSCHSFWWTGILWRFAASTSEVNCKCWPWVLQLMIKEIVGKLIICCTDFGPALGFKFWQTLHSTILLCLTSSHPGSHGHLICCWSPHGDSPAVCLYLLSIIWWDSGLLLYHCPRYLEGGPMLSFLKLNR